MAEGDGVSKNFRSAYYGKLGFCGNDEKNYLDLLIASTPPDLEKLNDLCERLELDRKSIDAWKILVGVDCGRRNPFDEYANVRRVRAEHFQSLRHHLEVLLKHHVFIKSRLMKKNSLRSNQVGTLSRDNDSSKTLSNNHLNGKDHDSFNEKGERVSQQGVKQQILVDDITYQNNVFIEESENKQNLSDEQQQEEEQNDCQAMSNTNKQKDERENSQNHGNHNHQQNDRYQQASKRVNNGLKQAKEVTTANNKVGGVENLLIDNLEAKPDKLITLMYLLEAGRLDTSNIDAQLDSDFCRKLAGIAKFFVGVSKDLQEAFFLFRGICKMQEIQPQC